jgi:hypothetical protein
MRDGRSAHGERACVVRCGFLSVIFSGFLIRMNPTKNRPALVSTRTARARFIVRPDAPILVAISAREMVGPHGLASFEYRLSCFFARELAHPYRDSVFFMSISSDSALFMTIPSCRRESAGCSSTAKKLGVGVDRLAKAIAAGQVAAVQIDDQKLVPVAAIERLAQAETDKNSQFTHSEEATADGFDEAY